MPKDPIVEEVRKYRQQYAAQFNYDLDAIVEDLKKKQKEDVKKGWKLVSFEVNSKTQKPKIKGKK